MFSTLIGSSPSLSSGFHPQSNSQPELANQDLETTLRCMVSANPTTWSQQLVWVEYARNTLPCSAMGLSPFECSLGYQPLLFPEQEEVVGIPSAQMFVGRCRHTWRRALSGIDDKRIATGTLLPGIISGRRYGCTPRITPQGGIPQTLPPVYRPVSNLQNY
jgi:hypothetical protein